MRKKTFEKLLKEAIILDAEEQGVRLPTSTEPIPAEAQARIDAALNEDGKTRRETKPIPRREQKTAGRFRLAYGLSAAGAAAVLIIGLAIGIGTNRSIKGEPIAEGSPKADATFAPIQPTSAPEATGEPEPEPTRNTSITFESESDADSAMMHFYDENRVLLQKLKEDLRSPEHGYIENGVVYPKNPNTDRIDRDTPCSKTTEEIQAFLTLPEAKNFVLGWNWNDYETPVFFATVRWTNEGGDYQTSLVYSDNGDFLINDFLYRNKGVTLEAVYGDAWGVYTIRAERNPYFTCTGTEYGEYPIIPPSQKRAEAEAFFKENQALLELAASEWPDFPCFGISRGKAFQWDEAQRMNVEIDPKTLSESLQKLVNLSGASGITAGMTQPEPVFSEDAKPYFEVTFPLAIDTTYSDPGTLYKVWLIYTENTVEQTSEWYQLEPLAENWYIYVYRYAY